MRAERPAIMMPARGSPRPGGVLLPAMPAAEDLRQQAAGSSAEPAWPAAVRGRPDAILTQIFGAGVVQAGPHPGHVRVTTDGDLVLPGPGPAGRREHARQLRPGQTMTAIAAHRAGPLRDGLPDLPAHRAGPEDRRPGTRGGPVPGTGCQRSAGYSVSPRHPPRVHRHAR